MILRHLPVFGINALMAKTLLVRADITIFCRCFYPCDFVHTNRLIFDQYPLLFI